MLFYLHMCYTALFQDPFGKHLLTFECLWFQAQKTQKPPQKASPTITAVTPVVKDPLVKKAELKPKPDTTGSFQAFKRTEVKVWTERQSCIILKYLTLGVSY